MKPSPQAANRQPPDFEALYDQHSREVWALAYARWLNADVAQDIANQLVSAGIRGLLNFAPVSINVPPDIALNAVDLAVQLEQISFQVSLTSMTKSL